MMGVRNSVRLSKPPIAVLRWIVTPPAGAPRMPPGAQDEADQDAWDKRAGQGAYSSRSTPSSSPFSSTKPVDQVRNSIEQDIGKIEGSQ